MCGHSSSSERCELQHKARLIAAGRPTFSWPFRKHRFFEAYWRGTIFLRFTWLHCGRVTGLLGSYLTRTGSLSVWQLTNAPACEREFSDAIEYCSQSVEAGRRF
jgi:hypothetical protein